MASEVRFSFMLLPVCNVRLVGLMGGGWTAMASAMGGRWRRWVSVDEFSMKTVFRDLFVDGGWGCVGGRTEASACCGSRWSSCEPRTTLYRPPACAVCTTCTAGGGFLFFWGGRYKEEISDLLRPSNSSLTIADDAVRLLADFAAPHPRPKLEIAESAGCSPLAPTAAPLPPPVPLSLEVCDIF